MKTEPVVDRDFTWIQTERLVKAVWNYKKDDPFLAAKLRENFKRNGQVENIIVRELPTGFFEVVNGNHRLDVIIQLEWPRVFCFNMGKISEAQAIRVAIETNETRFATDAELLAARVDEVMEAFGTEARETLPFSDEEFDALMESVKAQKAGLPPPGPPIDPALARATLAERFVVPPFSVLDARQGYWQDRKKAWLALGIRSEIGRGLNLLNFSETVMKGIEPNYPKYMSILKSRLKEFLLKSGGNTTSEMGGAPDNLGGIIPTFYKELDAGRTREEIIDRFVEKQVRKAQTFNTFEWVTENQLSGLSSGMTFLSGTSIFDPVLCEAMYRWFCPPGGYILDPFCGGSVRGIVAGMLERHYLGFDLAPEQIQANETQVKAICPPTPPEYLTANSLDLEGQIENKKARFDFIFSCPPYYDLEQYSEDPADLSNYKTYEAFLKDYRKIVALACARLRDHRFAAFVVGDIRDKRGLYCNFPADTVSAFEDAGLCLYNELALVTAVGSLPIRVAYQMQHSRKVGKTHQNVLVFIKGDPLKATHDIGEIDLSGFLEWLQERAEPGAAELKPPVPTESIAPAPAAHPDPQKQPARDPAETVMPSKGGDFTEANRAALLKQLDLDYLTPMEHVARSNGITDVWFKRDDAFVFGGANGGKVRAMLDMIRGAGSIIGITSSGDRQSTQIPRVAQVAFGLGLRAVLHTSGGDDTPGMLQARKLNAEIVKHSPGYLSVCKARAREFASATKGFVEIAWGLEDIRALPPTQRQVAPWPDGIKRLVVPCGSGMTLAAILRAMEADSKLRLPILGVRLGGDIAKRLDRFAPKNWRTLVQIVTAKQEFHDLAPPPDCNFGPVPLDPIYEAKCTPFLMPGDCLWIVGRRTE